MATTSVSDRLTTPCRCSMAAWRHAIDSEISCAFGKSPRRSSSWPQSKLRKRSTSRRSHRTKPALSVSAKKRRLRWWRGSCRGSEATSGLSLALRRWCGPCRGPVRTSGLSSASHGVHCTGALACARLRSIRARLAAASTAVAVACAVDIARRRRRWQQCRRRRRRRWQRGRTASGVGDGGREPDARA